MGARDQGMEKVVYVRATAKGVRAYTRAAKRAKLGLAGWVRSVLDSAVAALPKRRAA